jgi:hypothetical protein
MAGFYCIILASIPAMNIMSEHIAILPLSIALWLSAKNHKAHRDYLLLGIFLSLAIYTRLNLVFVALVYGIWVFFYSLAKETFKQALFNGLYLFAGFVLVTLLLALPYYQQLGLFFDSVFLAPLNYSQEKLSVSAVFTHQLKHSPFPYKVGFALTLCYVLSCFFFFKKERDNALIALLFLVAVEFSILIGGRNFEHYYIQLSPMLAVLSFGLLSKLNRLRFGLATSIILMLLFIAASAYVSIGFAKYGKKIDSTKRLSEYLQQHLKEGESFYTTDQQILYWLLERPPLSPAVLHPSNINKPFLLQHMPGVNAEPIKELQIVLEQKPRFILAKQKLWYFSEEQEKLFTDFLDTHYQKVESIRDTDIYQLQ